jgi:integrase/recombinase XerD
MGPNNTPLRRSQELWIEHLRDQGHSAKSREVYGQVLGLLDRFLSKRLRNRPADVTAADLSAWWDELKGRELSPATLCVYLRAARGWFRWLRNAGEIFLDPTAELRAPSNTRRISWVPTVGEMKLLLESVDSAGPEGVRDRAILETMYATALRRHEIAGLKLGDVDLDRGSARVLGKGNRERVVPLTRVATDWLKQYLQSARGLLLQGRQSPEQLWLNLRGRPLGACSLGLMVKRRALAVGLKALTAHSLRRACATHLLVNGAKPAELQLLLGHATLKHLSLYLQLGFKELQSEHARSKPGK